MSQPFFITSTGTGIGKTLVTTALCWQLKQQKKSVTAIKPVITGFDGRDMESDTALILQSCGLKPTPQMVKAISPWHFTAPLAPNMAAAKEGKTIDFNDVVQFCRDHTTLESDIVIAEGAGGVMAPLDDMHTMLDLMQQLGWPVVLVAGSYLGSLSHTLTALEALRSRVVLVRALIVSESEASTVPLTDTINALTPFVPVDIPIVKLPRLRVQEALWQHMPPIGWICE